MPFRKALYSNVSCDFHNSLTFGKNYSPQKVRSGSCSESWKSHETLLYKAFLEGNSGSGDLGIALILLARPRACSGATRGRDQKSQETVSYRHILQKSWIIPRSPSWSPEQARGPVRKVPELLHLRRSCSIGIEFEKPTALKTSKTRGHTVEPVVS